MVEITALRVYPVKALQGIEIESSKLTIRGLQFDRMWMICNENNEFVTQRQMEKLATVSVSLKENELVLSHQSQTDLYIPFSPALKQDKKVKVWSDVCDAFDLGDEYSNWITSAVGKFKHSDLRIVQFNTDYKRNVDANYLKGEQSHTGFSDGYPFLLANETTLTLLNQKLKDKNESNVGIERFRPNIIVKGIDAFEEFNIDSLVHANKQFSFGLRKPCQRCKVTTVNQFTGEISNPKEPLKTLVEINPLVDKKGAYFGMNSTLLTGEGNTIKVGDELSVP